MKLSKEISFIIFIVTILVIPIILFSIIANYQWKKLDNEYPKCLFSDSINDKIDNIYKEDSPYLREINSIVQITLKTGKKLTLYTKPNRNYKTGIKYLININDSIVKKRLNDTIYIYRNNSKRYKYYFLIR